MISHKDANITVTSQEHHGFSHHQSLKRLSDSLTNSRWITSDPHYWSVVKEISQWPMDSPHNGPIMRKADLGYDVPWHISADELDDIGTFPDLGRVTLYTLASAKCHFRETRVSALIIYYQWYILFKHIDFENVMSRSTTDGLLNNWQYLLDNIMECSNLLIFHIMLTDKPLYQEFRALKAIFSTFLSMVILTQHYMVWYKPILQRSTASPDWSAILFTWYILNT